MKAKYRKLLEFLRNWEAGILNSFMPAASYLILGRLLSLPHA